ncbi:hypothetical protein GCM10025795_25420 [Verticiella sediminum]
MQRAPRIRGQALAEAAVALVALAALFWAVVWTGRFLDAALGVAHASHAVAMQATRATVLEASAHILASGGTPVEARTWRAPAGLARQVSRRNLPAQGEPGAGHAAATALRRDWGAEDTGVQVFRVSAGVSGPDGAALVVRRASAILRGAGHAGSDVDVQQRLARGGAGWARAAQASAAAASPVIGPAHQADAGWPRARGGVEWLAAWAGLVPAARLHGSAP